jgi:uncharacterized repeat protein (TIGR01451 family)
LVIASTAAGKPDPTPDNNTTSDSDQVMAAPDLVAVKDDGTISVRPGEIMTYVLTVTNVGDQEATGVVVMDTLPEHTALVGVSAGGTETAFRVLSWPAYSLPVGATATHTVTLRVEDSIPSAITAIANTVTALDDGLNGADPTPGNNTAADVDTVIPLADLAVVKQDAPDPITNGGQLTYTILVTNNGPSEATGVILTDTLPLAVVPNSITPSQGSCAGIQTIICSLGSMGAGTTATVAIIGVPLAEGTITNTVTVLADTNDPTPANNTVAESTVVVAAPTPTPTITPVETATPTPTPTATPAPPSDACLVYAVEDAGRNDSQFFTIDLRDNTTHTLGPLHTGADVEALDRHPVSGVLYATGRGRNGKALFRVDMGNGALIQIGTIGYADVDALAFRPTDATLWGWTRGAGLIQIDIATGVGTLVYRASAPDIQGLAWSNDGQLLYGSAGTGLWVYSPIGKSLTKIANNLPGNTEALEMRPDGRLMGGVHQGALSIFAYDIATRQAIPSEHIRIPFDDIEGIAWYCQLNPWSGIAVS